MNFKIFAYDFIIIVFEWIYIEVLAWLILSQVCWIARILGKIVSFKVIVMNVSRISNLWKEIKSFLPSLFIFNSLFWRFYSLSLWNSRSRMIINVDSTTKCLILCLAYVLIIFWARREKVIKYLSSKIYS